MDGRGEREEREQRREWRSKDEPLGGEGNPPLNESMPCLLFGWERRLEGTGREISWNNTVRSPKDCVQAPITLLFLFAGRWLNTCLELQYSAEMPPKCHLNASSTVSYASGNVDLCEGKPKEPKVTLSTRQRAHQFDDGKHEYLLR